MRKLFCALLCLAVLAGLAAPAFADVIYEPSKSESPFYYKHSEECVYEGKQYYVNSKAGSAVFRTEPDGSKVCCVENGKTFFVEYIYNDAWALGETEGEWVWVRMEDLLRVYSYEDYQAEHAETDKTADISWGEFDGETICMWSYPGSGEYWSYRVDNVAAEAESAGAALENFISAYYLEDGLLYGYIGYFYGMRHVFVCVSDPCNPELPAHPVEQELYPVDGAEDYDPGEDGGNEDESLILPVILVSAAVAASTALLVLLRRKRS